MQLKKKLPEHFHTGPFKPSKRNVTLWFNHINRDIFNSQLTPFSKIVLKNMGDWWACVSYDDEIKSPPIELHLHTKFESKMQFINVLAHEMVHKWQLDINGDTANHNRHFYSWREKFTENGLLLTRKI